MLSISNLLLLNNEEILARLCESKLNRNDSYGILDKSKNGRNYMCVGGCGMDGVLRNMTSVFILKGDKILMLYRQGGKVVNNIWVASAGGHFEKDEINDAKACIVREMKEELGITEDSLIGLKLRYIGLRNTNGEVRQNYFFFADLKEDIDTNFSSNEGRLEWVNKEDVLELEMPFTAKYVMKHYLEIGSSSDVLYAGVANGKELIFTEMPEC